MRLGVLSSGLIPRASVAVTRGWVPAAAGGSIFALWTAQASPPEEPLRRIDARGLALVSGVNAVLVAVLWVELRQVLRAPVGLRRAQLAAQVAALALLVTLQLLASQAHG